MTITDQINEFCNKYRLSDAAKKELRQLSLVWLVQGAKQAKNK